MDYEAIPTTTTLTAHAVPGAPVRMNTVVVFGDSLCDIGKKWKSDSGAMAIWKGDMFVSPTGRFSDCRNWTDFMFEEATGQSLVTGTAEQSYARSQKHFTITSDCLLFPTDFTKQFRYANYAEGGACGATPPAQWGRVLGTFEQQVDQFEINCATMQQALGDTLFIIWFGANDLYTANCTAESMANVATQVASTQRNRLLNIFKSHHTRTLGQNLLPRPPQCKFIFVDLCRPLTSVRYTKRLIEAEATLKSRLPMAYIAPKSSLSTINLAVHLLQQGQTTMVSPFWGIAKEVVQLNLQIEETKRLERGVLLFNTVLAKLAYKNGDRVAEVGSCISEETISKLVRGHARLKAGAMPAAADKFISAFSYDHSGSRQHIVTKDEVHPTDQLYKLIWLEIYEQIKRSNCTFGNLQPVLGDAPLSVMAGPSAQTVQNYNAVMNQLNPGPRREGY